MLKYPHSIYINIVGVLLMKLFGLYKVLYAIKWNILTNLDSVVTARIQTKVFRLHLRTFVCILAVTSTSHKIYFYQFYSLIVCSILCKLTNFMKNILFVLI